MEYIRRRYGVPAKRGGRIECTAMDGAVLCGTIRSSHQGRIGVRFDNERRISVLHPTWNVRYLSNPQTGNSK